MLYCIYIYFVYIYKDQIGKSTLVTSLIKETFVPNVRYISTILYSIRKGFVKFNINNINKYINLHYIYIYIYLFIL